MADWPPTKVISAKTLDTIVRTQLRDNNLLTSNYKYFRGDSNMWALDPDLAWWISQWGSISGFKPSPDVIVPHPEELQPGTTILETYPDGSVRVRGQTGQCDSQASVMHSDLIEFATKTEIGFNFCAGFLWQYAPRGHSPNWLVDTDGKFWIFQVASKKENTLIDPLLTTGLKIHFIYEA